MAVAVVCSSKRLVTLARGLSPAYLRFGGKRTDFLQFHNLKNLAKFRGPGPDYYLKNYEDDIVRSDIALDQQKGSGPPVCPAEHQGSSAGGFGPPGSGPTVGPSPHGDLLTTTPPQLWSGCPFLTINTHLHRPPRGVISPPHQENATDVHAAAATAPRSPALTHMQGGGCVLMVRNGQPDQSCGGCVEEHRRQEVGRVEAEVAGWMEVEVAGWMEVEVEVEMEMEVKVKVEVEMAQQGNQQLRRYGTRLQPNFLRAWQEVHAHVALICFLLALGSAQGRRSLDKLYNFAECAGLQLILGLNALHRNPDNSWNSSSSLGLLKYSAGKKYNISWELGNAVSTGTAQGGHSPDSSVTGEERRKQ
ncbi:hypothetical protein CRUP_000940 [Coryphaenoides rupestris]|nr:hypothetical protein CRUP_000940 [Coryphaenoides rupestris]